VAKLAARLLATAALWVRIQNLSKILNGRHKQRSDQHDLARQKINKIKKFKGAYLELFLEDFRN
jgi:hypothetical protein